MRHLTMKLLILLGILIFIVPISIAAEEDVDVTITYGINGKIQMGKGFPLTVKIKNEGDSLSGDFVFLASPNYNMMGNIVVPVEIPKGEETIIKVSIPGYSDMYYYNQPNNNKIQFVRFFKDGWEDGEEIKLDGNTNLRPRFFPDNRIVIGALTDTPDTLNVLKSTRYNGESTEYLAITADDVAKDATGLEVFDLLIINDYNMSNLSDEQIEAIKGWVGGGGHLMIGSDPFLEQYEGLQDLFLLDIDGQTSFEDLNFLSKEVEEEGTVPNFKNVEINTGKLDDNVQVLYADHSLPMVMNKSYGSGEITQFAFDVGSDTLTNWDGYPVFWSDVLQKAVDKYYGGQNQRYQQEELSYRLGNVSEMYPSSFIPVKALIILFVVYLVILIPGLYFLLKKLDKREISWIIIPAVAILSSIAIFGVGAKERIAGSQINNVSILTVDETGNANGFGAFSILTNSGGDYSLTIKPKAYDPFPINRSGYNPSNISNNYAMIEKGKSQSEITFTDVEYWSVRSAMGPVQGIDTGKLTTELIVDDNQLSGTVTSGFPFDIDNAVLLSGSKAYKLGKIAAGSTIKVAVEIDSKNVENLIGAPRSSIASKVIQGYRNPRYGGYGGMTGPKDKEGLLEWKKFELLDSLMAYDFQHKNLNQPVIAGFTMDPITEIEADKKSTKINNLSLVTQEVNVQINSLTGGEFTLKGASMTPELSILSSGTGFIQHNGLLYNDNFVAVEPGEYQLTYQLPLQMDLENIIVNSLKIRYLSSNDPVFKIYNVKRDEFLELDSTSATFDENAKEFITANGTIILTFTKTGNMTPEVTIPTLEVKGEYNND